MLAVRALHVPRKLGVRLGVRHDRLVCAGADLLLTRQDRTLAAMLASSRASLAENRAAATRRVHVSHVHTWDEVQVKFRWKPSSKFRLGRKATIVPTMVQRSVIGFTLTDLRRRMSLCFEEYWLCKPTEVFGTTAVCLLPARKNVAPQKLQFDDLAGARPLLKDLSSFTFMPMGGRCEQ